MSEKLLSDEELREEILNRLGEAYGADEQAITIINLINTQKRIYAEMVVGLDDTKPSGLIANSTARNQLRAEQKARIK